MHENKSGCFLWTQCICHHFMRTSAAIDVNILRYKYRFVTIERCTVGASTCRPYLRRRWAWCRRRRVSMAPQRRSPFVAVISLVGFTNSDTSRRRLSLLRTSPVYITVTGQPPDKNPVDRNPLSALTISDTQRQRMRGYDLGSFARERGWSYITAFRQRPLRFTLHLRCLVAICLSPGDFYSFRPIFPSLRRNDKPNPNPNQLSLLKSIYSTFYVIYHLLPLLMFSFVRHKCS